MRYKVKASFNEEQRKGFIVTHTMEKGFETASEMTNEMGKFLASYNSTYCHHLHFEVRET